MGTLDAAPALAEATTPLSLSSFVTPGAWEPLRELVHQLASVRAELDRVNGKLSEVDLALSGALARRPADAAAAADALLRGEKLPPAPEGLAGMDRITLQAARDGLHAKRQELRDAEAFLMGKLRGAECELLLAAATEASNAYARRVDEELRHLHAAIDAAHGLLGRAAPAPLPVAWRGERLVCPPLASRKYQHRAQIYETPVLVDFSSGSGVQGAADAWRAAVKAACGVSSL